ALPSPSWLRRTARDALQELHPVAERIAELEAAVARNGDAFRNRDACRLQSGSPAVQVADLVGDMGLRSPALHALLDADMNLAVAHQKPEAAALAQAGGF